MENTVSSVKKGLRLVETASLAKSEANQIHLDTLQAHIICFFKTSVFVQIKQTRRDALISVRA